MRLIDADALKVNLDKNFSFGLENKFKLFNQIDEQPTVYTEEELEQFELDRRNNLKNCLTKEEYKYAKSQL